MQAFPGMEMLVTLTPQLELKIHSAGTTLRKNLSTISWLWGSWNEVK